MLANLKSKAYYYKRLVAVALMLGFAFLNFSALLLLNPGYVEAAPSKCYARDTDRKVQNASCGTAQEAVDNKCFLAQSVGGAFTQAGNLGSGTCNALQRQAQSAGGGAAGGGAGESDGGAGGTAGCSGTVNLQNCVKNNPIVTKVLRPIVLFLTGVVALVIIGSLIVAGIQYSAAQDNPQMVQKSKDRIRNALIALAAFMLTLAGLQYLIPGGLINI